jgi:hypothetical protein
MTSNKNIVSSPTDIINILRAKVGQKTSGLTLSIDINKNVVALVYNKGKIMDIINDEKSEKKEFEVDSNEYTIVPHIPLNKERFLLFASGCSGMGKSSLIYILTLQVIKHITKNIFYICGTPLKDDINLSKIKQIKQIKGEKLSEIVVNRDLKNSFVIIDDIDNWEYHDEAVNIMNQIYETGRKYKINLAYLSHITSNARETKIYSEVDIYITNKATNNRMLSYHLGLSNDIINEMDNYLREDPFICYNKVFNAVITDKKIYKI